MRNGWEDANGRAGRAAVALAALWLALFAAACRLDAAGVFRVEADEGVARRLLGSARTALAGSFYETADRYFHRGAGHVHEAAFHDRLAGFRERLVPESHEHAAGAEVLEIMPWLRFATDMDPHHVEAYLVAAFWAEQAGRGAGVVETIYREARRANPGDYRPVMAWGRFAARRGQRNAAALLEAALRLWPRGEGDARQAGIDRAALDEWLACLYGAAGRFADAQARVGDALQHHPQPGALQGLAAAAAQPDALAWRRRMANLAAATVPAGHGHLGGEEHEDGPGDG